MLCLVRSSDKITKTLAVKSVLDYFSKEYKPNTLEEQVRKRILLVLLAGVLLFSSGCGKKKEQEQAKAETQKQGEATLQNAPSFEPAKLDKAVESLGDFGNMVKKFSAQTVPTDMAAAQKQSEKNLAEANELARKHGFADISEMQQYIQIILYAHQFSEIRDRISAIPPAKQSQEVKDTLTQIEMAMAQFKEMYGEQVFETAKNYKKEIKQFLDNMPTQ